MQVIHAPCCGWSSSGVADGLSDPFLSFQGVKLLQNVVRIRNAFKRALRFPSWATQLSSLATWLGPALQTEIVAPVFYALAQVGSLTT